MTTLSPIRRTLGALHLHQDLLKQAADRVRELEQELALAHAHIRILELKLQRRPRSAESCALLIPQAE